MQTSMSHGGSEPTSATTGPRSHKTVKVRIGMEGAWVPKLGGGNAVQTNGWTRVSLFPTRQVLAFAMQQDLQLPVPYGLDAALCNTQHNTSCACSITARTAHAACMEGPFSSDPLLRVRHQMVHPAPISNHDRLPRAASQTGRQVLPNTRSLETKASGCCEARHHMQHGIASACRNTHLRGK